MINHIEGCTFTAKLNPSIPPVIWFMYKNLLLNKNKVADIVDNYDNDKVYGLVFDLPNNWAVTYYVLTQDPIFPFVEDCASFLKKYQITAG